jgi:hypothetical protein
MQTQTTYHSLATLAAYVEREIAAIPAGTRRALAHGPAAEAVSAALALKGYDVQRSGAPSWTGLDLVFADGGSDKAMTPLQLDRVIAALNPEARVVLITPDLSHRLERRLRAAGFLVRIRGADATGPVSGTPYVYDAVLVRRRHSLR